MTIDKNIDFHPSTVVVWSPETEKLLMAKYDEGYKFPVFRGSANNIGGNPNPRDFQELGPQNVLTREVTEEYDPLHPNGHSFLKEEDIVWASPEDIAAIRNAIVFNALSVQDFWAIQYHIEGADKPYVAIYSGFRSDVSGEVIEIAERNIKNGKQLSTEGFTGVFSIDDLVNSERGEFSTAHISGPMINFMIGSDIPHSSAFEVSPIGLPRRLFRDYTQEFDYDLDKLFLHN
jgi:hypothetical protein